MFDLLAKYWTKSTTGYATGSMTTGFENLLNLAGVVPVTIVVIAVLITAIAGSIMKVMSA